MYHDANGPGKTEDRNPGWNPLDPIRSLVRHNPPKKNQAQEFPKFH